MDKIPLSLVIVTRNEEKNLASNLSRCIRSVPFASDILLLDSSEGTGHEAGGERPVDVARKLGARILQEPWRGPARQRTRATALARFDWVLALEPDEALSFEAQNEIYELSKSEKLNADAYAFQRRTHYLGRLLEAGDFSGDYQVRLMNRVRAKWAEKDFGAVVEAPNTVKLHSGLLYWPYASVADQIERMNELSDTAASQMAAENETFSRGKMLGNSLATFINVYFRKGSVGDGIEGLIVALFAAMTRLMAWTKLYESSLRASTKNAPK